MTTRDMTAPVTRGEMHETLGTWAGAINSRNDARFKAIDARFDAIDARFEALEAKLDALAERTVELFKHFEETILTRLDALLDPFKMIPQRVGTLEAAALPERVSRLEAKVFAPKRRASKSSRRRS